MFYLYLIRTEIKVFYTKNHCGLRQNSKFCLILYILYLKALYTVEFFFLKKSILYATRSPTYTVSLVANKNCSQRVCVHVHVCVLIDKHEYYA